MSYPSFPPKSLEFPLKLTELLLSAGLTLAVRSTRAFTLRVPRRIGCTLRPGRETPLWNELRVQLRRHLQRRGTQARLGRLLGLPRQRINAFVTGGGEMPDAERTLQLLAWLLAVRRGRPLS